MNHCSKLSNLHTVLPDLLDQLPLDCVDTNIWCLLTKTAKGSLRQTSKATRQLADLLVTSIVLEDSIPVDSDEEEAALLLEGELLLEWHEASEHRAAYLARLPRLSALTLTSWPSDQALTLLLSRYGAATGFRVKDLTLHGSPLSFFSACAIREACPRLTSLEVECMGRGGASEVLTGDILRPLKDVPLASLVLEGMVEMSDDALRSVGRLTRLQHLELSLGDVRADTLRAIGDLPHLTHCSVGVHGDTPHAASLVDAAALFTLSRLTLLDLRTLHHDSSLRTPEAAAEAHLALAPLAGLQQLECLTFSAHFVADDPVFSVLKQLTNLRRLALGRIQLHKPMPCHLPLLTELQVASAMRPTLMLQTLLPLLPLPRLVQLHGIPHTNYQEPGTLSFDVGCRDEADAAVQAAALRTAAQHLAAAPLLRLPGLQLGCPVGGVQMSCRDIAQGLAPLAGRLISITLVGVPLVGAEWALLGACLPCLHEINIYSSGLTDSALAALASSRPALGSLCVSMCRGVTLEGWLGLAALRAHPVEVDVRPRLAPTSVARCAAVQAAVFGTQHLTFL